MQAKVTEVATDPAVAIQSIIQATDYGRLSESQTNFAGLRTLPQDRPQKTPESWQAVTQLHQ